MFDALIFDLDGTLWDAVDGICDAWNQALSCRAPHLAGMVTPDRVRPCMGMLLEDIIKKLFPGEDPDNYPGLVDACLNLENEHMARVGGILFPREEETLAQLARRTPLFIVSNCQDGYIEAFFQAHGLGRFFADWECPGRTGLDKAGNITLVMERNGLKRPLYIGDTAGDWKSATAAGVPFLHAAYGFGSVPPDVPHVDCFAQLPQAIDALCACEPWRLSH